MAAASARPTDAPTWAPNGALEMSRLDCVDCAMIEPRIERLATGISPDRDAPRPAGVSVAIRYWPSFRPSQGTWPAAPYRTAENTARPIVAKFISVKYL